ncbi:unnamed protein product [Calypogeia fissa]
MSVQQALKSVPGNSSSFVPVVVTSPSNSLQINRASLRYSNDGLKLGFLKHSNLRSHCLSSPTCFRVPKSTSQWRSRSTRLQTRAFQAVTADGDTSNGDGVGSSNHAMNVSPLWSSQVVASSLQGLQEGFRSLKEKGLQSSKEGFGEAYARLKTGDGKSLFENVRWSELATQGRRSLQSVDPWIKWPLAIFGGAYLVVWISCGMAVAQDLIPLWILGPLVTGSIIRSAYFVADLTQRGVARTKPLQQAVVAGTSQFLEDAKNGELIDKLRSKIEQKNSEWREEAAKKRADLAIYVKSGQAASDFKVFLLLKFSQLNDWSTDRYEDFAEWSRPYWRAFTRLMKKLF